MRVRRRSAAVVLAVVVAAVASSLAPAVSVADTSCPNVRVCFWEGPYYAPGDPVLGYQQNTNWTGLPGAGVYLSLKNRFNNRKVMIANRYDGELHDIRCVPPDANRELLNSPIDNFRVGDSGSDC